MTTSLPLIFTAPRRGMPPVHLADLDPAGRRDAVRAAGQPAFRADQLARHYFAGLTRDAAEMTDLPADRPGRVRRRAAARAAHRGPLAGLRRRRHPQDAVAGARRHADRVGADALPGPDHAVRVQSRPAAGWPARSAPPGRAACSGTCPPREIVEQVRLAARAARDGALGAPGRLSNVVFMGMGEPLANYKRVLAAVKMITAPGAARAGHLGPLGDGVDGRPGARDRAADRRETAGAAGGFAAHAGRRTARHAGPGERPLEDRRGAPGRPRLTPTPPAGGCRSSTR